MATARRRGGVPVGGEALAAAGALARKARVLGIGEEQAHALDEHLPAGST